MTKKMTSISIALLIAALAPGFGAYEAFAQTVTGGQVATGGVAVAPVVPAGIDANAALDPTVEGNSPILLQTGLAPGIGAPTVDSRSGVLSAAAVGLRTAGGQPALLPPSVRVRSVPGDGRGVDTVRDGPAPTVFGQARRTAGAVVRPGGQSTSRLQAEFKRTFDAASVNGADDADAQAVLAGASNPGASAPRLSSGLPLKGRKVLIVGSKPSRSWIIGGVLDYAKRTGLEVYLADIKENRESTRGLIDDAHFLEAEIDNHDPAVMASVTGQISDFAAKNGFTTQDRVRTYLNPMAELAAMVVDKLGVFGNGLAVIGAAHAKSKAREIFASDPELATAFEVINEEAPKDAADEAATVERVRAAFRRIAASGKTGSVVLKPIHGGGSALVIVDVNSEDKAVAAWKEINAGLLDTRRPDRKFDMLDHYPGVLMEYQFDGIEVDIETLRSAKGDDYIMMDNPPMDPPYAVEKGLTAPSQLPPAIQREGLRIASKALNALKYKAGNAHVEAKYSTLDKRWYILEVNARMGGGPVKPLVESVTEVNLIHEDLNAHFGLPRERTLAEARNGVGVSGFVIGKVTGKITSISGLEEAARMPGIAMADWFKKVGDTIKVAPEDMFDYFAMINAIGATYAEAAERLMAALKIIRFTTETKDGRRVDQDGANTHRVIDMSGLLAGGDGKVEPQAATGILGKLREAFKNLPGSFKAFMLGSSLLAMAQEGISIITSVYGIKQFGLVPGILSQAVELVFRIPGSLIGAKWVKRFDAKKIYIATTLIQGLLLLSLPFGAWVFGAASLAFLAQFLVIRAVQGLIYGATRGMAESAIMPRLLGQNKKTLETGGFLWMASVEAFALTTAFFISPGIRGLLGANISIAVFAAIMLASLAFFKKIKFIDEKPAAAEGKADESPKGTQDKLPWREYIPYVASTFLHFSFYSLFTGLFATSIFMNEFMSDRATGAYDLGSLAIGLTAAIPALLATLNAAESSGSESGNKGILDQLGLRAWFGVAAAVAAVYLWTGLAGLVIPGLLAALVLGSMTTVNRTKWMSSYLSRLKPERHARVVAILNSVSVVAALVPFAVLSAGKYLGVAIVPLLIGVAAAIAALLAVAWLLTRQPATEAK